MQEIISGLRQALHMIFFFDAALYEIMILSLWVSSCAIFIAALIALPLGTVMAIKKFPGRTMITILINALMGFPPVVVGLIAYLLLSRSGPFGVLDLLFTPYAMIIAQILLALPIIAALTRQTIADLWEHNDELLTSLGANTNQRILTLLWEARFTLVTALLTAFGRIIGEVGAVMVVGGNIEHVTRVLTTAIALETRKGNIDLAIGLGLVLIMISILINAAVYSVNIFKEKRA